MIRDGAYRLPRRFHSADCPACGGDGGWETINFGGYIGFYGPEPDEGWEVCPHCSGSGEVSRLDRLTWLIGESRERGPAWAGVTQ